MPNVFTTLSNEQEIKFGRKPSSIGKNNFFGSLSQEKPVARADLIV